MKKEEDDFLISLANEINNRDDSNKLTRWYYGDFAIFDCNICGLNINGYRIELHGRWHIKMSKLGAFI